MFNLLTMFFIKEKITFSSQAIQVGSTKFNVSLYQFLNNPACQDQVLGILKKGTRVCLCFSQELCQNSAIEEAIIGRITQICYERQLRLSQAFPKKRLLFVIGILIVGINLFLDMQTMAFKTEREHYLDSQKDLQNSIQHSNNQRFELVQALLDLPIEIESLTLTPSHYELAGFCEATQKTVLETELKALEVFPRFSQATSTYLSLYIKGEPRWKS